MIRKKFIAANHQVAYKIKRNRFMYSVALFRLLGSYNFTRARIILDTPPITNFQKILNAKKDLWNAIKSNTILEFDTKDSKLSNLIQLADMLAGAVRHSYESQDENSKRYIEQLNLAAGDIIEIAE